MNRTDKITLCGGLICIIAVLAGACLICGRLVMVEGFGKFILWLMPMAAAASLKDKKLITPLTAAALIILYLLVGTWLGALTARPIKSGHIGKEYCTVYEINPGAMGHTSYRLIKYNDILSFKVFGTNMLTVRILNSAKTCRSLDGIPSFTGI